LQLNSSKYIYLSAKPTIAPIRKSILLTAQTDFFQSAPSEIFGIQMSRTWVSQRVWGWLVVKKIWFWQKTTKQNP